jgi:hypothetical protein
MVMARLSNSTASRKQVKEKIFVFFVSLITSKSIANFLLNSNPLFGVISTIASQLVALVFGVVAHLVGVAVQGEGVPLGLAFPFGCRVSANLC